MIGIGFIVRFFQFVGALLLVAVMIIVLITAITWLTIIVGNMIGFNTNALRDWIVNVYKRKEPKE